MRKRTEPDNWELQDEYDFSRGVRGKHAGRFSFAPADEPPSWLRDAAHYDGQSWMSETLRRAQDLEGLFVAFLVLSSHLEPAEAGDQVAESLEQPNLGALRRVLEELGNGPIAVPANLMGRLEDVVRRRNWLVHKSLQLRAAGMEPDSLREFVMRLQQLSRDLASLHALLEELMKARLLQQGMTEPEFHAKRGEALRKWIAA